MRCERIYCNGVMPVMSLKHLINQLTLIPLEDAYLLMFISFE